VVPVVVPPVPVVPTPAPVPGQPALGALFGSGGGSSPGAVPARDNRYEPYFENNVSGANLQNILAYFGLQERFAALADDGQVDIVWLKFERRPMLRGLKVLIDGTERTPDLSATAGKLTVAIFVDQTTLTQRSNVVAVFGKEDAGAAAKANRRPLR
jgi:hypothetical protein